MNQGVTERAPRRRPRARRGFTLVEVIFSMIIFLMMVLVFSAVFPFAVSASQFSSNYQQAAMLAQHKIDQLRSIGYNAFVYSNGTVNSTFLVNEQIADSCSQSVVGGVTTTTCPFTDTDNIVTNNGKTGFFPAGSSAEITIAPDTNAGTDTSTGAYNAVNVWVTISWTGGGVSNGTYSAAAKLVEMVHN